MRLADSGSGNGCGGRPIARQNVSIDTTVATTPGKNYDLTLLRAVIERGSDRSRHVHHREPCGDGANKPMGAASISIDVPAGFEPLAGSPMRIVE